MQTQSLAHRYASIFALVVFFLLLLLFYLFYQRYESVAYLPNVNVSTDADGLRLKVSSDGHFRTSGTINGEAVIFMLDTGASGVAISEALAQRLGVKIGVNAQVSTANGVVAARLAQLQSLDFGNWTFHDVPVYVMPQMDDEVLLGMRILRHFQWNQQDGVLRLQLQD